MSGWSWQPIETAPENESVLIFIPNAEHYGHGVYRGMLVNFGTRKHWDANAVSMGRSLGPDRAPTHWMPLPPAPATTEYVNRPCRSAERRALEIAVKALGEIGGKGRGSDGQFLMSHQACAAAARIALRKIEALVPGIGGER